MNGKRAAARIVVRSSSRVWRLGLLVEHLREQSRAGLRPAIGARGGLKPALLTHFIAVSRRLAC